MGKERLRVMAQRFMAWVRGWMVESFTKIRNVCKGAAIGESKISSDSDLLD